MKLVALWFTIGFAVATAVAAGSCSVTHRSEDFACVKQSDCSSGRTCTDGFCVASQVDASVPGDATGCPAACTSCNTTAKACTIDCALNGGCKQQVTCPTGWSCNIACSVANACMSGINCTGSKSCTIMCSGSQSCRNVNCGTGACNVDCSGTGSCRNVNCGLSCGCDVACRTAPCIGLTCKTGALCTLPGGTGCTSFAAGCNTCP